jgi:hypothetical protein
MISYKIQATLTSVSARIPVNLPVTASETGGTVKVAMTTLVRLQSSCCDCGGSNSSRQYLFKEELQKLVDEIGVEIRIAHYPPYNSKYNPIEHRLFPHITKACQGVIFNSIETVKSLIAKTKTKKGLKVTVQVIDTVYQTGRKATENFKKT